MGKCSHGIHWIIVPDLSEVEKSAEDAEEKETHVNMAVVLDLRCNFYPFLTLNMLVYRKAVAFLFSFFFYFWLHIVISVTARPIDGICSIERMYWIGCILSKIDVQ